MIERAITRLAEVTMNERLNRRKKRLRSAADAAPALAWTPNKTAKSHPVAREKDEPVFTVIQGGKAQRGILKPQTKQKAIMRLKKSLNLLKIAKTKVNETRACAESTKRLCRALSSSRDYSSSIRAAQSLSRSLGKMHRSMSAALSALKSSKDFIKTNILNCKLFKDAFTRNAEIIDEVWYRAYAATNGNEIATINKLKESDAASIDANVRRCLSDEGIDTVKEYILIKYEHKTIEYGDYVLPKDITDPITGINSMGRNTVASAKEAGRSEIRLTNEAINQMVDEIHTWTRTASRELINVSREQALVLDDIISEADALHSKAYNLNRIDYSTEQLQKLQNEFKAVCERFDNALKKAQNERLK